MKLHEQVGRNVKKFHGEIGILLEELGLHCDLGRTYVRGGRFREEGSPSIFGRRINFIQGFQIAEDGGAYFVFVQVGI